MCATSRKWGGCLHIGKCVSLPHLYHSCIFGCSSWGMKIPACVNFSTKAMVSRSTMYGTIVSVKHRSTPQSTSSKALRQLSHAASKDKIGCVRQRPPQGCVPNCTSTHDLSTRQKWRILQDFYDRNGSLFIYRIVYKFLVLVVESDRICTKQRRLLPPDRFL